MAIATRSQTTLRRLNATTPALLVRAAHPRQAVLITAVLAAAAALSGRPAREVALVAATVLVGNAVLGWHNDLIDAAADQRHQRIKPLSDGLDRTTVSFALSCGVLLLIPLAVSNGLTAGACFGASIVFGLLSNVRNSLVRMGPWSWLPWALSFGLYPAFVSYGGWGSHPNGEAPLVSLTLLSALLGIGVHVVTALWGLVADETDHWRYLPLWLARRFGATTVLIGTIIYLGITAALIAVVAQQSGLSA